MFQVRGNRKRFDGIIRKLLGQQGPELLAEFFARRLPGSALEFPFPAHKFQPVRLGAPKPLHRQDQPLFGVIRNGQHSPRQVESFRPKMQKRSVAVSSHFPRQAGSERGASPILVQIHKAGSQEFLQARFEFGAEVHRPIITKGRTSKIPRGGGRIPEDYRPTISRWTSGSGKWAERMRFCTA